MQRGSRMDDLRRWREGTYANAIARQPERASLTLSDGTAVEPAYAPADVDAQYREQLGLPGEYPFTRGIYPSMYRGRLWTMRQYAGFGTAEETNVRYRYLLDHGQTGLSVAFDLPTQMGYDADHPMALGEVGRVGVAITTLDDMRALFDGIPLERVSVSMTINATASILLAFYIALADERGIPRDKLAGTIQNDILKEYIARGTYIYPVEPSLRLITDTFSFCAAEAPRWNPISISGYHIREAGSTAAQEIAFTFADAIEYVRRALASGIPLETFAPRLSFFFASHNDLFEEVAKFRAARRLWAKIMRDQFGGSDDACRLRFHTQTGGVTLTAQQPLNNVVRVTVQALAAVLGGTQSLHTNGFDEALALPTEESARLALRTQQVLAAESGVTSTADPLAGSYYVESLTDALEQKAVEYLARVEALGGAAKAVQFFQAEIEKVAYEHQLAVERGERQVVGVNVHTAEENALPPAQTAFGELESAQRARVLAFKGGRDRPRLDKAMAAVRAGAASEQNLKPIIIDAVKSGGTLGEISDVLRDVWGT